MREYTIAAIPADGIGPEVIAAGLEALDALQHRCGDFRLLVTTFDWGSHGESGSFGGGVQVGPSGGDDAGTAIGGPVSACS
jgi:hypothetical protein